MLTRPYVVGLTGGIGSGKSTVAERFQALGAGLVDTDVIAHELTAPGGDAIAAIRDRFGSSYIKADGSLDRAAMRSLVFGDAAAKAALESILHPMIRERVHAEVHARREAYVLLAVPLLLEGSGYPGLVDRVLVIDCPEEQQIARVQRRGLSEHQVRAIMAAQLPRFARLARADDIVDNSTGLPELDRQIQALDRRYRELAARAGPAQAR